MDVGSEESPSSGGSLSSLNMEREPELEEAEKEEETVCRICHDDIDPSSCGLVCGCRGSHGYAHLDCLIKLAASKWPKDLNAWAHCPTCRMIYVGSARLALARAFWARAVDLPLDDSIRIRAANTLATALQEAGQNEEAVRLQGEALEMLTKTKGFEDTDTLFAACNLGNALQGMGRFREAIVLLRKTFEAAQRVWGELAPNTLIVGLNLAANLEKEGCYAESAASSRRIMEDLKAVLGPEHPTTLSCCGNLASAVLEQGRYLEALRLMEQTLLQKRRVLGHDHPITLQDEVNRGYALLKLGRLAEAVSQLRKAAGAIERQRLSFGGEQELASSCGRCLGEALSLERAAAEGEQVVNSIKMSQGRERCPDGHTDVTVVVNSHTKVVDVAAVKVDEEEGVMLLRAALDAAQVQLGAAHPTTLLCERSLGEALGRLGRHLEAAGVLRRSLEGMEAAFHSRSHPEYLRCARSYANELKVLEEQRKQEDGDDEDLCSRQQQLGLDHDASRAAKSDQAEHPYPEACGNCSQEQGAAVLLKTTWRKMVDTLGPEHPESVACGNELVLALRGHPGREAEAGEVERELSEFHKSAAAGA